MATSETVPDNLQDESLAMRAVLYGIRKSFPSVNQLNTETLEEWLKKDDNQIILLDVREMEEYQVSHLREAKQVKPDEPAEQVLTRICPKLDGYRSSAMALKISEKLKENTLGSCNIKVYNLEGSLFKWANEHRSMVDCKNIQTKFCHPYNIVWGKLLQYDFRKYPDK